MKNVIFSLSIIVFITQYLDAQTTDFQQKRFLSGLSTGIGHQTILQQNKLSSDQYPKNNFGLRFGIMAEYKLSNRHSLLSSITTNFNENKVILNGVEKNVLPLTIEFAAHFSTKLSNKKLGPYFLFGPSYQIPISTLKSLQTKSFLSIDLGLGFESVFSKFIFSPEIRYSYGLTKINDSMDGIPVYGAQKFSLVFNFKGEDDNRPTKTKKSVL